MATAPSVRNYQQAKALIDLRARQGRDYAKLWHNVYLEPRFYDDTPGAIAVRYYQTDIVTFYPDGRIELRCGGWQTVTTKQNINAFSPFTIYQEKGVWYVNTSADFSAVNKFKGPKGTLPPGIMEFKDGMILDTPEWARKLAA